MSYTISTEELINEIQRLAGEIERTPSKRDMRERGEYSSGVYSDRFGSWSNALEEAGYSPNIPSYCSDEDLIRELHRMDREYTSPPTYREMDDHGKYSTTTYENRFNTWNEALKAAGLDTRTRGEWNLSGEDHPRWKGKPDPYYGQNWPERREEALERDGHTCRIPGCEMTTGESKKRYGHGLHVHHIERLKEFEDSGCIDYKAANALSNLVTLCTVHHTKAEFGSEDIRELVENPPSN